MVSSNIKMLVAKLSETMTLSAKSLVLTKVKHGRRPIHLGRPRARIALAVKQGWRSRPSNDKTAGLLAIAAVDALVGQVWSIADVSLTDGTPHESDLALDQSELLTLHRLDRPGETRSCS
jgi:hypothetical protein